MGWVANSDEHLELMLQLSEDSASGRTAAVEELRRTYGTEHGIHATYTCDDKAKLCILYYKALERRVALSLTDIIGTIDQLDGHQPKRSCFSCTLT